MNLFYKGFCLKKQKNPTCCGVKDTYFPTFSSMYCSKLHIKGFPLKWGALLLPFVAEGILLEKWLQPTVKVILLELSHVAVRPGILKVNVCFFPGSWLMWMMWRSAEHIYTVFTFLFAGTLLRGVEAENWAHRHLQICTSSMMLAVCWFLSCISAAVLLYAWGGGALRT